MLTRPLPRITPRMWLAAAGGGLTLAAAHFLLPPANDGAVTAGSIGGPPALETDCQLPVTVTAYNSEPAQTDSTPNTTAFGDRLHPGKRAVAVSEDLYQLGIDEGTRVQLDELPGEWVVADKMGGRWHRRVDVYFGNDREAAKEFGVKHLTLRWCP